MIVYADYCGWFQSHMQLVENRYRHKFLGVGIVTGKFSDVVLF